MLYVGALGLEWIWHRYEWQPRTAIHAHGVVKLKNDPGLVKLVSQVYAGRLLEDKLEDPQSIEGENLEEILKKVDDGRVAEKTVLQYVDTFLTAVNTRNDPVDPGTVNVPVPHPCSVDIFETLRDSVAMNQNYKELANCVQRHVCRPNGY